jgi:retinal rod rhodopsin-sensitive cGMP 3',5'-cyclic phosphodiesterase subunit delta
MYGYHHTILGTCIEQWFFHFGFVMRGSENTWQQTIEAAPPSEMLPSDVLSGNVIFETSFFNDEQLLGKTSVRIYYV